MIDYKGLLKEKWSEDLRCFIVASVTTNDKILLIHTLEVLKHNYNKISSIKWCNNICMIMQIKDKHNLEPLLKKKGMKLVQNNNMILPTIFLASSYCISFQDFTCFQIFATEFGFIFPSKMKKHTELSKVVKFFFKTIGVPSKLIYDYACG